jgi:hypothetical protein
VQKCVEFFQILIDLSIQILKSTDSPPEEIFYVLYRVFGGDRSCRKFFERFGTSNADQSEKVDGIYAFLPVRFAFLKNF